MGQGQSSTGGTPQNEVQNKADYYELLGLERQATDEEIKKAYRRKALELHPDRNYGNVDHATQLFAEIQSAYEVLSDPQERAWYDSHRDDFLRDSQPDRKTHDEFFYNIRMTTADDVLKLMMKHRGRLDYSNSNTGFYSGLREFFSQLAKEEEIAYRWENMDPVEYPDFGQNDDDYIDVVRPFYAAWNSFATKKSYLWKDYYRLSDAPDRRVRRLMEKENKGLRDDAIRDFNDAVRSLVAFVRKRDPRYQENQKSEEERQKTLRDATAAQSTRSRASRQAKLDELDRMTVPDWATSTKVDEHQGGFSSNEDSEQQEIECVACNKTFKSEAQYEAHERSKKHIKLLKQLQREMRSQDQEFRNPVHHPASDADDENGVVGNGVAPIANDEEPHVHEPAYSPRADSDLDKDAGAEVSEESSSHEDDDDCAPRAELEGRLGGAGLKHLANHPKATVVDEAHDVSDVEAHSVHNLGKAKQKRAKKAAQRDGAAKDSTRSDFKCAACQVEFPSKTKLFNHIKEKGHAAPVTIARFKVGKSGKGKKR